MVLSNLVVDRRKSLQGVANRQQSRLGSYSSNSSKLFQEGVSLTWMNQFGSLDPHADAESNS